MRKLTVLIEGDSKEVQFDESVIVTGNSPYILVKTVTVYWNYNDFAGYNDYVNGSQRMVTLTEGYWTFQMLVDKLKVEGLTLEASKVQ